jgi:hypothetical protein
LQYFFRNAQLILALATFHAFFFGIEGNNAPTASISKRFTFIIYPVKIPFGAGIWAVASIRSVGATRVTVAISATIRKVQKADHSQKENNV